MTAFLSYLMHNEENRLACQDVVTIGRDQQSDIVISDPLVSRNHATISRLHRDDYYLIDNGSSNGSFLNGTRITLPMLLSGGDEIKIGSRSLRFMQAPKVSFDQGIEHGEDTIQSTQLNIRQITVLVADIRDFTTITEESSIKLLTTIMSSWFRQVQDCVVANGGVVEKFIGDCVHVRWLIQHNIQETIHSALKTAYDIHVITRDISASYDTLRRPLRVGVGINSGYAALDIGHAHSAIGDTVNVAFRLESASKQLGKDIVLGEESYRFLPKEVWRGKTKTITLKGKKEHVKVCGLLFDEIEALVKPDLIT